MESHRDASPAKPDGSRRISAFAEAAGDGAGPIRNCARRDRKGACTLVLCADRVSKLVAPHPKDPDADAPAPELIFDEASGCYHATVSIVEGTRNLAFTCSIEGKYQGFQASLGTARCVFACYRDADVNSTYCAWLQCLWSLFHDSPDTLQAVHAQLLLAFPYDLQPEHIVPTYTALLQKYGAADSARITLLVLAGQTFEAGAGGSLQKPFSDFLWLASERPFATDVTAAMTEGEAGYFFRKPLKLIYELDRTASVSTFRYTGLHEVLAAARDDTVDSLFGLGLPDHSLKKSHLPDFTLPTVPSEMAADASTVAAAANVPFGALDRSETFLDRALSWDKAVKTAENVLHRLWVARSLAARERVWLQGSVANAVERSRSGTVPGEAFLRDGCARAVDLLGGIQEAIKFQEKLDLAGDALRIVKKGAALQMTTRNLIRSYGPDVGTLDGSFESGVATIAGKRGKIGTAYLTEDGHLDAKGVGCMPTGLLDLGGAGVLVSEGSKHNIRLLEGEYLRSLPLMGSVHSPGAMARWSDSEVIVTMHAGAVLALLTYKEADLAYSVQTVSGSPSGRSRLNGQLGAARFAGIQCVATRHNHANGKHELYIGDGGALRRTVGGLRGGAVETVVQPGHRSMDGDATKATAKSIASLAVDDMGGVLYFSDLNSIRSFHCDTRKVKTVYTHPFTVTSIAMDRVYVPLRPDQEQGFASHVQHQISCSKRTLSAAEADAFEKRMRRERTHIPRIVFADDQQTGVYTIMADHNTQHFAATVQTEMMVGRFKQKGFKDGAGGVALFENVTGVHPCASGGFYVTERNRVRLLSTPAEYRRAGRRYKEVQAALEDLTEELLRNSKASNVHSASLVDVVRSARLCLLDGRKKAEAAAYEDYGLRLLQNPREAAVLSFAAAAPTIECLRWVSRKVIEKKVCALDSSTSHSFDSHDCPHALSDATRTASLQDAVDVAISRIVWPQDDASQRKMLAALTDFESEFPMLVGPHTFVTVLRSDEFRVAPCDEFFAFSRATLGPLLDPTHAPSAEILKAVEHWAAAAIPKTAQQEKVTTERLHKGVVKLWFDYHAAGPPPAGSAEDKAAVATLAAWSFRSMVTGNAAATFLTGVGTGVTAWIQPDSVDDQQDWSLNMPDPVIHLIVSTVSFIAQRLSLGHVTRLLTVVDFNGGDEWTHLDCSVISACLVSCLEALPCLQCEELSFHELLESDALVWAQVFSWRVARRAAEGANFAGFVDLCRRVAKVFTQKAAEIQTREAPLRDVVAAVRARSSTAQVWDAIGVKKSAAVLEAATSLYNTLVARLDAFEEAVDSFFDGGPLQAEVRKIRAEWHAMPFGEALTCLQMPESTDAGNTAPRLDPVVMAATEWLRALSGNAIFRWVWDTVVRPPGGGAGGSGAIVTETEAGAGAVVRAVRDRLRRVCADIDDETVTFATLLDISRCLTRENAERLASLVGHPVTENFAILQTARAAYELKQLDESEGGEDVGASFPPPTTRVNTRYLAHVTSTIEKMRRVMRVKDSKEEIKINIELLSEYVRSATRGQAEEQMALLDSFALHLEKLQWNQLTAKDFSPLEEYTRGIGDELLSVSSSLVRALAGHKDFAFWLSELSDDQNFSSAIEMAMGKPEMECPPELWVDDGAGPGHPDEQRLSQLSSVRTALRTFLYGDTALERASVAAVAQCLSGIKPEAADAVGQAIEDLAPLQLPLAELLSHDTDMSALSSVANLYQPSWEARWTLSAEGRGPVAIHLAYVVRRAAGKSVPARQNIDELLDFQSSVVLARARGTASGQETISCFVAQFMWVRDLCDAQAKLKVAGHPAAQQFSVAIPLSVSPDAIRAMVTEAEARLAAWEGDVAEIRYRFPCLNAASLRQLLRLALVHTVAPEDDPGSEQPATTADLDASSAGMLREVRQTLFPAAPASEGDALLSDVWEGGARESADFVSKIDMMMNVAPAEWSACPVRRIDHKCLPPTDDSPLGESSAVRLVISEGTSVLETVLSHYVQIGVFPDWRRVLCVAKTTPLELITNLLLRWALTKEPGPATPFCLAGIDEIPEALHHKVVVLILDLVPRAKNPLLLVAGTREHYVVRQLSHWRVAFAVLSKEEIKRLGMSLSGGEERVSVYTSPVAGAGKTFAIHRAFCDRDLPFVHVPLHGDLSSGALIEQIETGAARQQAAPGGDWVLHLDLSDGVVATAGVLIFELLVLRSLYDKRMGRRFFLDESAIIAIECAPGAMDSPVLSCLPTKVVSATDDTFVCDPEILRGAMGSRFLSGRHDGCTVAPKASSNAYERLRWVAQAIAYVEENAGTIPSHAAFTSSVQTAKTSKKTFGIICKAAGLTPPVSLWRFWSFVDVCFWLARSAFEQDSSALWKLMSLPHTARLRGEAFDFICRTSADFSTRQQRIDDNELMWLRCQQRQVNAGGEAMGVLTHYYRRTNFRSGGQPVFQLGTFLDANFVFSNGKNWCMSHGSVADDDCDEKAPAGLPLSSEWRSGLSFDLLTIGEMRRVSPHQLEAALQSEGIRFKTEGPLGDLKTWNEANHEVLLALPSSDRVSCLGVDRVALIKRMHPDLLAFLENNDVEVGCPNKELYSMLSALTGVSRDAHVAAKLLGGTYCLTGDILLKILAVFVRSRCGVPVVLMGECGCGKTHMLRYVCAWLGAQLLILDVHGGTTQRDIINIFRDASKALQRVREIYVFLDEVNTCAHMGLITEAIVSRSLRGVPIDPRIHVLAALNPYRKRKEVDEATPGLSYAAPKRSDLRYVDPMEDLVYRVHPIPQRLQEFVFDFGGLTPAIEARYAKSMTAAYVVDDSSAQSSIARMLVRAMSFVRDVEGDVSAVSLRDLKRALRLGRWFHKNGPKNIKGQHPWASPCVLGILHVFYFRLSLECQRTKLLSVICHALKNDCQDLPSGFQHLNGARAVEDLLKSTMTAICSRLEVEEGIAMNQALKENLYVTMICVFNRVPVMVVGKPGTSKTLTLQVLASNLRGANSTSAFWSKFPALHVIPYQCSPLSSAAGIRHQFEIACNYQTKAQKTIVVLLLDEIGLAEHSPDMPLKVLHAMLVDPAIAIIGLSNWTLDAAKMNRAICLRRPEPATGDIHITGEHILRSTDGTERPREAALLKNISAAYHEVYTQQKGREFIGMRDYYHTVKLLKRELNMLYPPACVVLGMRFVNERQNDSLRYLTICAIDEDGVHFAEDPSMQVSVKAVHKSIGNKKLVPVRVVTHAELANSRPDDPVDVQMWSEVQGRRSLYAGLPTLVAYVLMRNFSGNPELAEKTCAVFGTACFGDPKILFANKLPTPRLIASSLADPVARHLMVLTSDGAGLGLLFDTGLLNEAATDVLVGGTFRDDSKALHLIQQVNRVKAAMAQGTTVVLHNFDAIYESLYDVLNQRYVTRTIVETGKEKKMLRLAIGSRSQLCPVEDGFKIVVVAETAHAHENLDLPLLNRFEKQILNFADCLDSEQVARVEELTEWVDAVVSETDFPSASGVFSCSCERTVESLVFSQPKDTGLAEMKSAMARLAVPLAVLQSESLREVSPGYMKDHGSLSAVVETMLKSSREANERDTMLTVVTSSPLEQGDPKQLLPGIDGSGFCSLRLAEVSSGIGFASAVKSALGSGGGGGGPKFLLVQTDPVSSSQPTIDHALRIVEKLVESAESAVVVVFLVHVPQSTSQKRRRFNLNFRRNWRFAFVDDVRSEAGATELLMRQPLSELIAAGEIDVMAAVRKHVLTIVALLRVPWATTVDTFHERVRSLLSILAEPEAAAYIENAVASIFEKNCEPSRKGLHRQVVLATGELCAGSLRTSLHVATDALLVQCAAHVIKDLDTNFNLRTYDAATKSLWCHLLRSWSSGAQSAAATVVKLDGPSPVDVKNTGSAGPLIARFPFSFRLIPMHESLKEPLTKEGVGFAALENVMRKMHGDDTVDAMHENSGGDITKDAYFHDAVSTLMTPVEGLPPDSAMQLHQHILHKVPGALDCPLGVHMALWQEAPRLLHLSSLLSALEPAGQEMVLQVVAGVPLGEAGAAAAKAAEIAALRQLAAATLQGKVQWAHALHPTLALDCEALGYDVTRLRLIAAFISDLLQSYPQLDDSVPACVDAFKTMPLTAEALLAFLGGLSPGNPVPEEGIASFFVTFAREFALPARDPIEDELVRLCAGGRSAALGLGPAAGRTRRGLLHALLEAHPLQAVADRAARLRLPEAEVHAFGSLVASYLEAVHGERCGELIPSDVKLVGTPAKAVDLRYIQAIAKARRALHRFVDMIRGYIVDGGSGSECIQLTQSEKSLLQQPQAGLFVLRRLRQLGGEADVDAFLKLSRECNFFVAYDRLLASNSRDHVTSTAVLAASSEKLFVQLKQAATRAIKSGTTKPGDVGAVLQKFTAADVCCLLADLELAQMAGSGFAATPAFTRSALEFFLPHDSAFRFVSRMTEYRKSIPRHALPPHPSIETCLDIVFDLMFQVAFVAPKLKDHYIHTAATQPRSFATTFIPGFAAPDTTTTSMLVVAQSSFVTWYTCANGHLYSVGECGLPMQSSTCAHPGCSSRVGGHAHVPLPGNKRLGTTTELLGNGGMEKGYVFGCEIPFRPKGTMHAATLPVLRLLFNLALGVASVNSKQVSGLHPRLNTGTVIGECVRSLSCLSKVLCQSSDNLRLSMCNIILALSHTPAPYSRLDNGTGLMGTEAVMNGLIARQLHVPLRLPAEDVASLSSRVLSGDLYADIFGGGGGPPGAWAPAAQVSLPAVLERVSAPPLSAQHPLLQAVADNARVLPLLRGLPDILEWHRVLFGALARTPLTKQRAAEWPARAFVEQCVPEGLQREHALSALGRYCRVFNDVMPLLPNLYECQENPFLGPGGRVDLGGDPQANTPLTPDAPLSFSLPSMIPGAVDAPGACSIQLAGLLQRAHNAVVTRLTNLEADDASVRSISHKTAPSVVRRMIIDYDHKRDLLPLLFRFQRDDSYDYDAIEKELAARVFKGKLPVRMQLAHFEYSGEVRQRGVLAALSGLDQSSSLPAGVEEVLATELDTQHDAARMLRLLEDGINFTAAVGANIPPRTPLTALFKDFLGRGGDITLSMTSSVAKYGEVRHLKALYLFVEALQSGEGALHRVSRRYAQPLSEEGELAIRRAFHSLEHSHVAAALRELLVGALSEADVAFPDTESLKDYIGYQDLDVGSAPWFEEHFPSNLQLCHAVNTFHLLTKLAQN
ncbi:hypothetical protein DIPPA_15027 [Diplonema papillatum]|nr:hypothetical protein DIPPA_15027 [Diplonema papillatum]